MVRRQKPPSQSWKTFLRNHGDAIAAIDLCVVPTATFERLFAFLIVGHGRRQLLWFGVTRHPTAEWLAQQIVEAFPWNAAPVYLVRDNDGAYGQAFRRRVRTMGIRDRPTSPRSPWQNPYAERLIGTLQRECLDHEQAIGRSRGGLTTKIHALVDALGNPHRLMLSPGQAHDLACAEPLLENIDPQACIADKAYDADAFIDTLTARKPLHHRARHYRHGLEWPALLWAARNPNRP